MDAKRLFLDKVGANLDYWEDKLQKLNPNSRSIHNEMDDLFIGLEYGLKFQETRVQTYKVMIKAFPLIENYAFDQDWIDLYRAAINNSESTTIDYWLNYQTGFLFWLHGNMRDALKCHNVAYALAIQLRNPSYLAVANYGLCLDYWKLREYSNANRYGLIALNEFEKTDNHLNQRASTLNALAMIAYSKANYDHAEELIKESLFIWRSTENRDQLSRGLINQAVLFMETTNIEAAINCFSEAISLNRVVFSAFEWAKVEIIRGEIHYRINRPKSTISAFLHAYDWLKNYPSRLSMLSLIHYSLGKVNFKLGNKYKTRFNIRKAKDYLNAAITPRLKGEAP